jgi:transposase-like protein
MAPQLIPFDIKQQGQTWLLPPYSWAHRRISKALGVSASMVSVWRNELVNDGLLPEYENPNEVSKWSEVCWQ